VPFGSHPHPFAPNAIFPSGDQKKKDEAVVRFYKKWKKKHLKPGCNPGELVVESKTKPSNLTVSEAHGYGMIILAYMAGVDPDAKTQFDAMLRFHRAHPSRLTSGIMSWNQTGPASPSAGRTEPSMEISTSPMGCCSPIASGAAAAM
jgi:hypothetical protein